MTYNISVKDEALADALEAYLYYEDKQEGLGERFLVELNARYELIAENPQYFVYVSADKNKILRDVKLNVFPYLVIYKVVGKEVTVYAVHNCYKKKKDSYK